MNFQKITMTAAAVGLMLSAAVPALAWGGHYRGGNDVEISVENDDTHVTNNVVTVSNTGFNKVDGRGRIRTGNAGSEAVVTNFVNTTVIGGSN